MGKKEFGLLFIITRNTSYPGLLPTHCSHPPTSLPRGPQIAAAHRHLVLLRANMESLGDFLPVSACPATVT
ncbi:unnamed protein product [Merluccius merluccius]